MKKRLDLIILPAILLVALCLRFYKLGRIPQALSQDETSIGYNAYSILQTGKDEYGKAWPLYFKAFGEYKSPVYIYLTAILIKLFGLNAFAVRFPSAFSGVLTVLIIYFLAKEILRNSQFNNSTIKKLAIFSSLLLAINPWHLHYSRTAFEVTLAVFFTALGWLLLLKKKEGLGIVFLFLSIYSYNISRLLAPVMLLIFYGSQKQWRNGLITAGVIFLLPILFSFGSLSSVKGPMLITSPEVLADGLELRSYIISFSPLLAKIFFNRFFFAGWQYLNNLASFISAGFFFITGSVHGNQGIGNSGQFYLFELPLIVFALFKIISQKEKRFYNLIYWSLAVIGVVSLTQEVPHANRALFLVIPLIIFSAYGLMILAQKVSLLIKLGFLAVVIYAIAFYFLSYYYRFPVLYAPSWRTADKEVALYLKNNQDNFSKIIIDQNSGFMYTSLLFYGAYIPSDFQQNSLRYTDDAEGFSRVKSFGKYEFRPIDWQKDYQPGILLIAKAADNLPLNLRISETFFYPTRPVVLVKDGEIFNYPVTEKAYAAITP
jgi:4-amino-4-deoxy-L-arabinose transferase-like glycosyltransferase